MRYEFQIVKVGEQGVSDRYYEGKKWKTVLESYDPSILLEDVAEFLNNWDDDFPLAEHYGDTRFPSKITDYWFRINTTEDKK